MSDLYTYDAPLPESGPNGLPILTLTAGLPTTQDLTTYGEEPAFNIQRGTTSPLPTGMVADAGTLSTLLDNISRDLDPNNTSSPFVGFLRPKVAMAAKATWGPTTYDLLTGRVDDWPQSYPMSGTEQYVDFRATDLFQYLANTPINTSRPPERTGERIQAVLDSIDYPGPTDIQPGMSSVCGQNLQTVAALSHLGDCAQVEYGEFGIDASGVLRFRGRPAITTDERSTEVQAEYVQTGGLNFVDATMGAPPIINHVVIGYGTKGRQVTVRDQDSIDSYDVQPASISLPFQTASQARCYGRWLLLLYAQPRTTFTTVTFEPINAPGEEFDLWADLLGRKEGDLVQITLDPLVAPYTPADDRIVRKQWVRGINYAFDQSRVTLTLQDSWLEGLFYWDTSELDGPDYYGL